MSGDKYDRLTALLLFAAGCLFYLSFSYAEMAGSDLWWHLAAGRELLQTGTPWMVDDWSFSALGAAWFNPELLSDLVYYVWAHWFGIESLVYWKWLIIIATYAILQQVLARQSGSAWAGFFGSTLALAVAAPFLDVRPHLYTLLGFSVLLCLLLGRPVPPVRSARLCLLALLFCVWANLHGGVVFGIMALGILLFPWRDITVDSLRTAVIIGGICLLAAMLNPFGIKTFLLALNYAFEDSSPFRQVAEWRSPFRSGGIRSPLFFVLLWVPALGLAYAVPSVRRRVSIPWEGMCLTALTLAMALTSRRFIPLFAISLVLMLAPLAGVLLQSPRWRRFSVLLAALAVVAGVVRLLPYPLQSAPAYHYLTGEYTYPVDTMDFVEANDIRGNVFALWNWGGYIHWRTDGKLKVYIDGRADTVYKADTYHNYMKVAGSSADWLEFLEATDADLVLWPHAQKSGEEKIWQLLDSGRWVPVYRDSVSWLLARKTYPLPDRLRLGADTPWRDLTQASIYAKRSRPEAAIEYAEKVRSKMPWHKGACNLLTDVYRDRGEQDKAKQVLQSCRSYFPSNLLR